MVIPPQVQCGQVTHQRQMSNLELTVPWEGREQAHCPVELGSTLPHRVVDWELRTISEICA